MVRVVDAIMGTGKSSAAITYMNEHPDKRYIYITPYVTETKRIAQACQNLKVYEPQKKSEYHGSKVLHTIDLVKEGHSIATTHQAFRCYPSELIDLIKRKGYTLIIDEDVDILESFEITTGDITLAVDAGYIKTKDGQTYCTTNKEYSGSKYKDIFEILESRDIVKTTSKSKKEVFYWYLPVDLITSFEDVFVLTYLFKCQSLHHLLVINNIPYEFIGIELNDGVYRFSSTSNYIPSYVSKLKDMIHILEHPKLNSIGDDQYALSISWFGKNTDKVKTLKNNVYNYFKNICKTKSENKLWSTYSVSKTKIQGKGYTGGFLSFNTKAKNEFRNKTVLAYCVNIFMNVGQKLFYQSHGIDIDEDMYALSIMLQWIWRSAIRDGNEIWIYIPSKRMRTLLINWINSVCKAGDENG